MSDPPIAALHIDAPEINLGLVREAMDEARRRYGPTQDVEAALVFFAGASGLLSVPPTAEDIAWAENVLSERAKRDIMNTPWAQPILTEQARQMLTAPSVHQRSADAMSRAAQVEAVEAAAEHFASFNVGAAPGGFVDRLRKAAETLRRSGERIPD